MLRLLTLELGLGLGRIYGYVQSGRFGGSVLTVRENASGPFAILDVGASSLFEQPEAREHDGQSPNAFHHNRQLGRGVGEADLWDQRSAAGSQDRRWIRSGPLLSTPSLSPSWPLDGIPTRERGPRP